MRGALAALASLILTAPGSEGATARADGSIGVRTIGVSAPHREQPLSVTVWYPAEGETQTVLVGDNAVFAGVEAQQDAPVAGTALPLVLVSHGGMRAAPNLGAWIAARLARRGIIAAVVEAPRLGPKDAGKAIAELWRRPADLSVSLSAMETDPEWSTYVDTTRIGALGFFLGGTSVLSLAGAEFDAGRFAQSCDGRPSAAMDCAWFEANAVDLHGIKAPELIRSNYDSRVRVSVAVDPELSRSLSPESLAKVTIPVEIINLGAAGSILPGLDASGLIEKSPELHYTTVPEATWFSAFALCKTKGAAILAEEGGDDAICANYGDRSRDSIHAELTETIVEGLRRGLYEP